MFAARTFAGQRVAVFGLARSGISCAQALIAGGAEVLAWDDSDAAVSLAVAAQLPVTNLHQTSFDGLAALVLSPGVPLTHPEPHWTARKAQAAGIQIVGDTEVFVRELAGSGAKLVAITGTNGKSTATALTTHVLKCGGLDVEIGGNIGNAVFNLRSPHKDMVYVIELSSFQIDLTPSLAPDVAILTNITPDHLDRHGTLEHYADVKARIFSQQTSGGTALIGVDDTWGQLIAEAIPSHVDVRRVSVLAPVLNGIHVIDGVLQDMRNGTCVSQLDLNEMTSLRGRHNWQNAAMAFGAGRVLGLTPDGIGQAMKAFRGLAHRMQAVATLGNVIFVNDSKATNAEAAEKALSSFENIYWIAGGIAKAGGIASLAPHFDRITCAYLIGIAADEFAEELAGKVETKIAVTLEAAVAAAARDAAGQTKPAVVLLSPACASFDQFKNFEIRGDAFVAAVSRLPSIGMKHLEGI